MKVRIFDETIFNPQEKTALSIRDGVLDYYGKEIGQQPDDKIFKIYRSPATTSNAAMKMAGLPVTNDHISLDMQRVQIPSVGNVEDAKMIDVSDRYIGATIAVMNHLKLSDEVIPMIDAGKKELSLGYLSDLETTDTCKEFGCDFEQFDIVPHHLAIVQNGRCGDMCSFIDKKTVEGEDNMKIFLDANGKPDIKKIKDALGELPGVVESLDEVQKKELEPILKALDATKDKPDPTGADDPDGADDETNDAGCAGAAGKKKTTDADKGQPVSDEKHFTDADVKRLVDAQVSKQLDSAVVRHTVVVDKAKAFLADDYAFAGKTTAQIIDAVLEQEYEGQKFSDKQKDFAFDLLKIPARQTDYSHFADSKAGSAWDAVGDKEV